MNHKDFNKKSHKGVCLLCWTQLWLLSIEFISNKFQIYETVFFIMSPLILHNQQFEFKFFYCTSSFRGIQSPHQHSYILIKATLFCLMFTVCAKHAITQNWQFPYLQRVMSNCPAEAPGRVVVCSLCSLCGEPLKCFNWNEWRGNIILLPPKE